MIQQEMSAVLHAVSQWLLVPCLLALGVLIFVAVWQIGDLLVETMTERRKRADVAALIRLIHGGAAALEETIEKSALLRRHKRFLCTLVEAQDIPPAFRTALARELLSKEESRYGRITGITDTVAKLGPMFGLLGTLIPLGPGIVALGQGDALTLSNSLAIAFDTTIVGVITAAVGAVISQIRKRWYEENLVALEALMDCVLEEVSVSAEG